MFVLRRLFFTLLVAILIGLLPRFTLASLDGEGAMVGTVSPNGDGTVTVTINGTGFVTGVSVTISATPCVDVKIQSSTQLTCVIAETVPLTNIVITYPSTGGSGGSSGSTFTHHTLFVTLKSDYDGNLGGLTGANSKCAARAAIGSQTSHLNVTWLAVLSDGSTNARDRIALQSGKAVKNTAGQTVVSNAPDLWGGTLSSAIVYNENGGTMANSAWTGSTAAGNTDSGSHCDNWGTIVGLGTVGGVAQTNSLWIRIAGGTSCNNQSLSLYCISVEN